MQSRVVGQMESWRGRGRRAGRDALSRLKAGPGLGALAPGGRAGLRRAGLEKGGDGVNGAQGSGRGGDDGGGDAVMTADAGAGPLGTVGAGRPEPDQDRASTAEQRPAGRPEQARVTMPDRRESTAEHSRVPGWLQSGAAWSWRLLVLALAIYLIARVLGVLYIVVVPCIVALLLT